VLLEGVSAIVPTWNESPWLPTLVRRLQNAPQVTEIIVADYDSVDGTADMARAMGCKVVQGGPPGAGRNSGARHARCDFLLFTDADVVITPEVVHTITDSFEDTRCNLIHFRISPATDRKAIQLCYSVADLYARICKRMNRPQGSAPLIAVRRSAFLAVGGFDEALAAAEDADFIRRVGMTVGGVSYIRFPELLVSARRFLIEPLGSYAIKCLVWSIVRFCGMRVSVYGYAWQKYTGNVAQGDPVITPSIPEIEMDTLGHHDADGASVRSIPESACDSHAAVPSAVPEFTFVIPTRNEEGYIGRTLRHLAIARWGQKLDFDIVIVDGRSDDRTVEEARRLANYVILDNTPEATTIAHARNAGSSITSSAFLFHTDADVLIPELKQLLDRARVEFSSDPTLAGISVPIMPYPWEATCTDWLIHRIANLHFRVSYKYGSYFARGECQIVRRSAFEQVGGYRNDLVSGEDCDLFRRLSHEGRVKFLADYCVYHSPRRFRQVGYLKVGLTYIREWFWRMTFNRSFGTEWPVIR
jgi:glycosyltransferase involved in cell wall biosynthesis